MPSSTHQWLLVWIARKMTCDGYVVTSYEGPTPQGGMWNTLPRPLEIAGIRPDAWGVMPVTGALAIGEAKTGTDLLTAHTQKQLRVLSVLLRRSHNPVRRLYLAVPQSAVYALDRALIAVGLIGEKRVVRLHIPDCIVLEAGSREYV